MHLEMIQENTSFCSYAYVANLEQAHNFMDYNFMSDFIIVFLCHNLLKPVLVLHFY